MYWGSIAFAYHVASRLAYVFGVGYCLVQQDRRQVFTRRFGAEEGFARFRQLASRLMSNDALSFVLLCAVTRGSMASVGSEIALGVAGIALIAVGVSVRLWANKLLGPAAYYWHNFFAPDDQLVPERLGPYRFLKNPMYTLGYAHVYGIALLAASWPGLIAAVIDQAAILVFCEVVEKPHFNLMTEASGASSATSPAK